MKDKIVQVKNPRTGRYIRINREKAIITGHKKSAGPYKNIPIKTSSALPKSDCGHFAKWIDDNPEKINKLFKKGRYVEKDEYAITRVTRGSGNVFKDIGCSFSTLKLIRSKIKSFLDRIIK